VTGALGWAGIGGPALFVAVFLVLGAVKPGYDARARFVSEGSVGELGWIQIVNFVVLGAALLAFSAALWNGYGDEVSGRIGAGLMAAVSVGLILSGVFVTDPGIKIVSRHGLVHVIAGMVVFGGLMLACLAFAWRLHAHTAFAAYSVATSVFILIGFVVTPAAGRWIGLAQRVLIIVAWTWITLLAWRLATT
jgi:hypothetical membrane protein